MKIILDIPDMVLCAFLNGVRASENGGAEMFSFQLDLEDLQDGKETKLPRVRTDND
jgi:hypothetical protein